MSLLARPRTAFTLWTQEFDLFEGENVFTVQAVPTLENGLFGFEGYSTSQAVMSDEERICDVYYLAQITNLQHSLDEEGNSILQFDDVENANAYIVKVNDIEVQDVQVSNEAGKTVLNIGKTTKRFMAKPNSLTLKSQQQEHRLKVKRFHHQLHKNC